MAETPSTAKVAGQVAVLVAFFVGWIVLQPIIADALAPREE